MFAYMHMHKGKKSAREQIKLIRLDSGKVSKLSGCATLQKEKYITALKFLGVRLEEVQVWGELVIHSTPSTYGARSCDMKKVRIKRRSRETLLLTDDLAFTGSAAVAFSQAAARGSC
jgi:hypothetical protein